MASDYNHTKKYVDGTTCPECFQRRVYYAMELSDGGDNADYASATRYVCIYAEILCGGNCDNRN